MEARNLEFRVAIRARKGRYGFQIFTVAGEPQTFRSDTASYASPDEAAQAGYAAVAAMTASTR